MPRRTGSNSTGVSDVMAFADGAAVAVGVTGVTLTVVLGVGATGSGAGPHARSSVAERKPRTDRRFMVCFWGGARPARKRDREFSPLACGRGGCATVTPAARGRRGRREIVTYGA